MGLPPTGEIVARPMLKRACGCTQEFQHYAVDKYRAQRQAKFQRTRCPACVAKLVEEQRIAATLPKKGEAFGMLPANSQMTLTRRDDGIWVGTLTGDGTKVDADGESPHGVTLSLARRWLAARGHANTPPSDPAAPAPAPAAPAKSPAPAKAPAKTK